MRNPLQKNESAEKALTLMVQGTASSVGKSVLVAGLCRLFARRGVRVAPFKSQNMALNSYVTHDGLEIGRAQAVQAEAAGIFPTVWMNPILLKPTTDRKSQVIVMGKVHAIMDAGEYYRQRISYKETVLRAYEHLKKSHELVLIEGAGSPAEINLMENDLVNMGMADMADCPVVLVGDIDRGGVFASLYGTVMLLPPAQRERIQGFIINKFRGDVSILQPGIEQLEAMLNIRCLGVLPYQKLRIEEEDSLAPELEMKGDYADPAGSCGTAAGIDDKKMVEEKRDEPLDIAVLRLPRLSNFTDVAPLRLLDGLRLRYVDEASQFGHPHLVIVPGSKSTMADLDFLRRTGLDIPLLEHASRGGFVIGLCGGYQMLGRTLLDPLHVESDRESMAGLGLLDVETTFLPVKHTARTVAYVAALHAEGLCSDKMEGKPVAPMHMLTGVQGMRLQGYEIHTGETRLGVAATPFVCMDDAVNGQHFEGAVSANKRVLGTYLHGIFENIVFSRALMDNIRQLAAACGRLNDKKQSSAGGALSEDGGTSEYGAAKEAAFDALADMLETFLDISALERILHGGNKAL